MMTLSKQIGLGNQPIFLKIKAILTSIETKNREPTLHITIICL